ncbi:hypothetical protein [Streptomyces erythrochromogenes]|uniref:hypothetical protein n=1 Tax=Streptomyces erythrochromogenes TaxID=285574 RepID=UPI0036C418ED
MSAEPIEPTAVFAPGAGSGGSPPPPGAPPAAPPMPDWWNQPQGPGPQIVHVTVTETHTHLIVETAEEEAGEPEPGLFDGINPRIRWGFFNASAGAVGYSVLSAAAADPLGGAVYLAQASADAVPLSVLVLTGGSALAGWQLGRFFRGVGGLFGRLASPVGALGAAMWGQGTGPLLTALYAEVDPWPGMVAPAVLAGGSAVALWWLVDRRFLTRPLLVRWVARIPLATVVLSAALYAPGALS